MRFANFYCVALPVLLMLLLPRAWGQATQDSAPDWLQGFENYSHNRYVIGIPFSNENLIQLRKRRSIYRYRLLYISVKDLASPDAGFMYIGFFKDKNDAEGLRQDSSFLFSNQSVKPVSQAEHRGVMAALKKTDSTEAQQYLAFAIGPDSKNLFENVSKDILASAKSAYINRQYVTAIAQYRLLAALSDDADTSAWAVELIGLCQEKLKQFSEAIKTYASLLESSPGYSGIARVQQRHRGLTTAALDEQSRLRKAKQSKGNKEVFTRGVFGQSYRTLTRKIDAQAREEYSALLASDLDVRSSIRWGDHALKARINGFRIDDALYDNEPDTRIKRLFLDYHHRPTGTNITLGRIKDHNSGVYTSFDGISVSYPVYKDLRLGFSTGLPVYFAEIYEALDYYFYSAYVAWDINKRWRINSYISEQTLNDVTDRRALGFRAHYFDSILSSTLHVDYDFAFDELNSLLWTSSYVYKRKSKFSATLGQQKSPFLSATNILIGQPELDLDLYLRSQENRDALLEDALERTSSSEYYVLTFNREISSKLEFSLDYTQSKLSDIPAFERLLGISVVGDTDMALTYNSYSGQIVVQQFFTNTDSATIGARSSSSDAVDSLHLYIKERLRAGKYLDVQPKLSYTQSDVARNNAQQQVYRYSLSFTYKPFKAAELSVEAGGENINTGIDGGKYSNLYGFIHYRINF